METKEESIYQIYDRIFKRIFNLSNLAIINLINGLFGTNYPPDSQVEYYNKEFVNASLSKRFADIFITICGVTYHLEAQMQEDKTIVLRVFEYNFYYAMENRREENVLHFSEPMVIYLDSQKKKQEKEVLLLDFGKQGTFSYEVRNFYYQAHDVRELNQRKMVILIPFQLLKLKELIKKQPTKENSSLLRKLIMDDIMGSVKANLQVGNITEDDAEQLTELSRQLYVNICHQNEEMGGLENMKPLLEGALELPLDKYRIRIDELEEEKAKAEEEKAKAEEEKAKAEEEKAKAEEEKTKAEEEKARAEEKAAKEIEELKKRIKELEEKI